MRRLALFLAVGGACTFGAPALAGAPVNGDVLFTSNRAGLEEIYAIRPDGTALRRLTWNTANDLTPRLSPTGHHIAFARIAGPSDSDVWIMGADGTNERPLTSGPANDALPVFTPDGEHVVFQRSFGVSGCPCGVELWLVAIDGGGARRLETGPGLALNPDVAPNGKLAFVGVVDSRRDIYVTNLRGGPVKRVTDGSSFGTFSPRWSPHGNDLVFVRNQDGTLAGIDVWRVHHDGTDLRRLSSGTQYAEDRPAWSPDGRRVLYGLRETATPFGGRLVTVDAETGGDEQLLPQLPLPFEDSFDDGRFDAGSWSVFPDAGTSLIETNGRVEMAISSDAVPGGPTSSIDAQQNLRCTAGGDYDVSVAYELLDWPSTNGVQVALSAHFTSTFIWRESSGFGEQYVGITPTAGRAVATDDLSGTLRLVRQGGLARAMVREGDGWRVLAESPSAGSASFSIQASSFAGRWAGRAVRVAFDEFRLDANELTCPPFWRDQPGDWAAG